MIRLMFRICAWFLLVAITFVTLGSAQDRPQTHLSHNGEHALAFLLLGIAFGAGYANRRVAVAVAAVPVIATIEALQLLAPGRHARFEDFGVNLLSFWLAFAVFSFAERFVNSAARAAAKS